MKAKPDTSRQQRDPKGKWTDWKYKSTDPKPAFYDATEEPAKPQR